LLALKKVGGWPTFLFLGASESRMDSNERASLEGRITLLAEQVAASMGLEVVLVEIKGGGGRSIVRVFIDQPGGISLSDCERFSKRFSAVLDVEDTVPFSYILEASSPGLDRRLVKAADFVRFSGKAAKVRTRLAHEGQKNFQGKIIGVTEDRLGFELATGKRLDIPLADIEKANLLIEI
jgi:ribosome maturation factor RimP